MQKIVFSITNLKKGEVAKLKGAGYIIDDNILYAAASKTGSPYIRVLKDAVKYCHNVPGTSDEFKGLYSEAFMKEYVYEDGTVENKPIVVDYFVWYKKVD